MNDFATLKLPNFLSVSLNELGIIKPTPIQEAAIPIVLDGRDLLASAETGSGKTIAYCLPIIMHLLNSNIINTNKTADDNSLDNLDKVKFKRNTSKEGKTSALILLPTRELAIQIRTTLTRLLGAKSSLNLATLIGGEEMRKQFDQLRREPRIIIGTPGRVSDHLNRASLSLKNCNFLILDETDRMLDMGFAEQLSFILNSIPKENQRQTLMFSATMPGNITKLSQQYLTDPHRIQIGEINKPAPKIKQQAIETRASDKFSTLLKELEKKQRQELEQKQPTSSTIIFVKTQRNAQELSDQLSKHHFNVKAMHGGLSQRERDRVMRNFRSRETEIIVATDLAARGLDVPHIEYVFNYHLPECPEDYIHRIGRTGRAGAEGYAFSLVAPEDTKKWLAIDRLLQGKSFTSVNRTSNNRTSSSRRDWNDNPRSSDRRGSDKRSSDRRSPDRRNLEQEFSFKKSNDFYNNESRQDRSGLKGQSNPFGSKMGEKTLRFSDKNKSQSSFGGRSSNFLNERKNNFSGPFSKESSWNSTSHGETNRYRKADSERDFSARSERTLRSSSKNDSKKLSLFGKKNKKSFFN